MLASLQMIAAILLLLPFPETFRESFHNWRELGMPKACAPRGHRKLSGTLDAVQRLGQSLEDHEGAASMHHDSEGNCKEKLFDAEAS